MWRGKRLVLKPFEEQHLALTHEIVNSYTVVKANRMPFPVGEGNQKAWYENVVLKDRTKVFFSVYTLEGDEFIGCCGLRNIDMRNRMGEAWFFFKKLDRGKGYGVECLVLAMDYGFGYLGLNKVVANVAEFNTVALHVDKKFGFHEEGLLREEYFFEGKFHNVHRLGLLASEFYALHGAWLAEREHD